MHSPDVELTILTSNHLEWILLGRVFLETVWYDQYVGMLKAESQGWRGARGGAD